MHVGLTLLNCLWEQEIVLAVKRGKKLVSNVAILCTITANQKLGMERSNRAVKVSIKNKNLYIHFLSLTFERSCSRTFMMYPKKSEGRLLQFVI